MFSLNEKVIYPGHGVAKINCILERNVAGKITKFFELAFLNKDMTILVPVDNASSVGLRPLCTKQRISEVIKVLSDMAAISIPENITNWNKRNKNYKGVIQRGNLIDICDIYKELRFIQQQKELSFGEKSILQQAESLIAEEVALVQNTDQVKARDQLRTVTVVPKPKTTEYVSTL